jgi:hypothetical protein
LRGEIIGPRGALFGRPLLQALYVSIPVCYPEEFAVFRTSSGDDGIMAWLAPVTLEEVGYVRSRGWSEFEHLLESEDADLCDLDRTSIV